VKKVFGERVFTLKKVGLKPLSGFKGNKVVCFWFVV